MINSIEKNIKKALTDLTEARRTFLETVGLSVPDFTPNPAHKKDIMDLEEVLQQQLPPSYRMFLLLQNGFPEFDGETNILSIEEMTILAKGTTPVKLLDQIAKKVNENYIRQCIIFGKSKQSTSLFLFNPKQQNDNGEWAVIEYDDEEGIESTYENFLFFLKASALEAEEAAQEASEGLDLLDIDF